MCETWQLVWLSGGKKGACQGAFQHVALCLVSRCDKRVAASKVFTIHRPPKVLTLCLKRFEAFTGEKITKVCAQLGCSFLCPEQEISQSSTLFHKLVLLGFSLSLPGRGEFPWEDKHVLCSSRAALAESSFLPPKALHVALGKSKLP